MNTLVILVVLLTLLLTYLLVHEIDYNNFRWYRRYKGGVWYKQVHIGLCLVFWSENKVNSEQCHVIKKEDYRPYQDRRLL